MLLRLHCYCYRLLACDRIKMLLSKLVARVRFIDARKRNLPRLVRNCLARQPYHLNSLSADCTQRASKRIESLSIARSMSACGSRAAGYFTRRTMGSMAPAMLPRVMKAAVYQQVWEVRGCKCNADANIDSAGPTNAHCRAANTFIWRR